MTEFTDKERKMIAISLNRVYSNATTALCQTGYGKYIPTELYEVYNKILAKIDYTIDDNQILRNLRETKKSKKTSK